MAVTIENLANILGDFPGDCSGQQQWLNRLIEEITKFQEYILNNTNFVIVLNQPGEPTQLEWETAWTQQTGLLLPILPAAWLIWMDTANNTFGGLYGTVIGDTTVYRRESAYPKGATIYFDQDILFDSQASAASIYGNDAIMPVLTFTLPTICNLHLHGSCFGDITSGTGSFGLDFRVNGDKVGTTVYGQNADYGIFNRDTDGILQKDLVLKDMPAGDYVVRLMVGVVGNPATPPTITFGGLTLGDGRLLIVRAIAQ